jgi:O-antigen/teichoic acid export membrane protein
MSRIGSLWRDFAVNAVGSIAYAAAQWAVLMLLARLGSPAVVGEYALALALTAPVMMFANLRLNALLASDAARRYRLGDYLSARAATTVAAFMVCVLVALWGDRGSHLVLVITVMAFAKACESFGDLAHGFLTLHGRFPRVSLSFVLRGVLTVAGVAAVLAARPDALGATVAFAAAILLVVVAIDLPAVLRLARAEPAQHLGREVRRLGDLAALARPSGRALEIVREALPLGFVALALSLNASVPRLFLERELGLEALGYFSALAYVIVGARLVMLSLASVAIPRLGASHARDDRPAFLRMLMTLVGFGTLAGLAGVAIGWLFGEPLLALLYGAEYAAHAPLLVLLLAAGGLGFVSTYLQDSLVTMRVLLPKALLLVVVAAALAVACAMLVPAHGLMGAGWAVLVGAVVELVGSALLVRHALVNEWRAPVLAAAT